MKILIVAEKNTLQFIQRHIVSENNFIIEIFWDDLHGLRELVDAEPDTFDAVIVGFENKSAAQDMINFLEATKNKDSHTEYLNFYSFYDATIPMTHVDRIMQNPTITDYKGIILGICLAQKSILSHYFPVNFANFGASNQDIYYNKKVLEYCVSNYYTSIKNLEYCIFDMYTYTYFNYDVSLSSPFTLFLGSSFYLEDEHNYSRSKFYKYPFDDLKIYFESLHFENIKNNNQIKIWNAIFKDIFAENNYADFVAYRDISKLRMRMMDEAEEEKEIEKLLSSALYKKSHEQTIAENTYNFDVILQMLKTINPNIKIYPVLMPKYFRYTEEVKSRYPECVELFYTILNHFSEKYDFEFLDYSDHEISKDKRYFFDFFHLNYFGADKITRKIISDIGF